LYYYQSVPSLKISFTVSCTNAVIFLIEIRTFPGNIRQSKKVKTMRYLVEEVEEETEAWRKGEALANKLNIAIDSDKYYTYASRFLMTYIVMAGKGKDYLVGGKE
jgi:hypothetical protein